MASTGDGRRRRCQWHLQKSIATRASPRLTGHTAEFVGKWFKMNTIVSKEAFRLAWDALLQEYPAMAEYMQQSLGGENFQHWALPYQVVHPTAPGEPPDGTKP